MKITVTIPGKLILIGEYAVLYGANALVSSVSRYAVVSVENQDADYCCISSSLTKGMVDFRLNENGELSVLKKSSRRAHEKMRFVLKVVEKMIKRIKTRGFLLKPFKIHLDTRQFFIDNQEHKLGIGSSAALTVGMMIALIRFWDQESKMLKDRNGLFRLAYELHSLLQGKRGSGIDIAASIYRGLGIYSMAWHDDESQKIFKRLFLPDKNLYILPVWTGKSASTLNMLMQLEDYQKKYPRQFDQIINELINLSDLGCSFFQQKKYQSFIKIINEYYLALNHFTAQTKIPIVSERHKHIAAIVTESGGYYKPSGAGAGDIGLCFSDSALILETIKENLTGNKLRVLPLQFENISDFNE